MHKHCAIQHDDMVDLPAESLILCRQLNGGPTGFKCFTSDVPAPNPTELQRL